MKNESSTMVPLESYLNNGIRKLMSNAYKSALSNPKEALFIFRMQKVFGKSEKKRSEYKRKENLDIPPFLISSIATDCNLSCKGCYAHANNICGTAAKEQKEELTAEQWKQIFQDAATMGINFNLLAGGEPLLRKDILKAASEVKDMIFPIFTNGTVITGSYLDLFAENLNLIPVISLEGSKESTDDRRGQGVFNKVIHAMELLKKRGLFYGASVTVSTENLAAATSSSYITLLKNLGCKIIFFIEYVPSEAGTEHLALDETGIGQMEANLENLRKEFADVIFLSFPGDEKAMGGCLAVGRGFFHVGPDGRAEACPFSPYSDSNVAQKGLKETLKSPFFAKLRESGLVGGEHTGGCTLFEYEEEVKTMLNSI
ncbi:MAG: radical SAM protein [Candidatus Azobacteroides sp.]|nr:radical SAM protein [Candidatus Azobacteroides sp.]